MAFAMSTAFRTDSTARPPAPTGGDRLAAALLAVPALLTLALVLHHPVVHGRRGAADVAAGISAVAGANRVVHGGLLVLLGAQVLGFTRFAGRLGWGRLLVAGGFLAYAAGALLLTIPLLLDGFVAPDLAAACRRAAQGCTAADGATLRLLTVLIQVFTKAGLVATAGATGAWGLALLRSAPAPLPRADAARPQGFRRTAGILGLGCAVAPVAVLAGSDVYLRPGSLAGMVTAQVVWCLLAAALLMRGGAHAPRAHAS